jgi:carnitine-CoA ligase
MSSLWELLETSAARTPDKVYLVFKDLEITYKDFLSRVREIAVGFQSLGLKKGDKIALILNNGFEFPQCWFAANMVGAIMVPVNTRFVEKEIEYILTHSEAKAVVTSNNFADKVLNIQKRFPNLETIITIDSSAPVGVIVLNKLCSKTALPEGIEINGEDAAVILYTSGTTGNPKGCLASQNYFIDLASHEGRTFQLTADDRVYTAQPVYYMDPQWNIIMVLIHNATLVIAERFSTAGFWDEVRRNRITVFYCIGSMTSFLFNMPPSERDKQHNLRMVKTSGIPPSIHKAWEERFNVPVFETYGSTETGADTAVFPGTNRKVGTACVGRPIPYREIKIVDDKDIEVPQGETGEITLKRGRGMMAGYYKDFDATERAFKGGWFHTGDLGYIDPDGDLHFVGRQKDIIRRGGENISATSIEHVLITHPKILDAAAVPVPDNIRGEEVKVYVVPRPGQTITDGEVISFCEANMAEYKIPRYVEIRESLPKTPSERVQKEKLKQEKRDLTEGAYDRLAERDKKKS